MVCTCFLSFFFGWFRNPIHRFLLTVSKNFESIDKEEIWWHWKYLRYNSVQMYVETLLFCNFFKTMICCKTLRKIFNTWPRNWLKSVRSNSIESLRTRKLSMLSTDKCFDCKAGVFFKFYSVYILTLGFPPKRILLTIISHYSSAFYSFLCCIEFLKKYIFS